MHECRSAVVAAAAILLIAEAHGQTADSATPSAVTPWTSRYTPDGQPDLQGTWVNFDITPFETDTTGPLGTIEIGRASCRERVSLTV